MIIPGYAPGQKPYGSHMQLGFRSEDATWSIKSFKLLDKGLDFLPWAPFGSS